MVCSLALPRRNQHGALLQFLAAIANILSIASQNLRRVLARLAVVCQRLAMGADV